MTIVTEISKILKSSKQLSELEEYIMSLMKDKISASFDEELVQPHQSH